MTNQIGRDNYNSSDWFWTKWAVRGTAIIFIYHEQQLF